MGDFSMISRMKKMLSKICMFGLATSMSFGFGSFLASALPEFTTNGTLIPNSTAAEITLGIDNAQENGRARLVFNNFVGTKNVYDGNSKLLLPPNTPSITLDSGSGEVTPAGGSSSVTSSSILTWSNNSSPSVTALADTGFSSLNVWVRAIENGTTITASSTSDTAPGATPWVQIITNGEQTFGSLNTLTRTAVGTYDFYYYIEGSPFGTDTTTGNGKIIEDLVQTQGQGQANP